MFGGYAIVRFDPKTACRLFQCFVCSLHCCINPGWLRATFVELENRDSTFAHRKPGVLNVAQVIVEYVLEVVCTCRYVRVYRDYL